MNEKVLVTYATKYGATKSIADYIGQRLQSAGFMVTVQPVHEVEDIMPYDGIILGSAVYAGQWRKEAATFLKDNAQRLASRSVWLFSSGPTGEGDPVDLMNGWTLPPALRTTVDYIRPHDITCFGGFLQLDKINLLEKLMIKMVKAPAGDFRNWDDIDDWATSIIEKLHQEVGEPVCG